nr:UDP-phosphate alpha-N-acetylglucosaminyltransferase [Mycolicibacter nonchromogenicus]
MWTAIVAFGAAGTIFFDPRYTGAVMLGAMLIAIVVTLIPLLRRGGASADSPYDTR